MKTETRATYITRDTIMKLLSDEEIARVSTAETQAQLANGEEYVDLEEPNHGVRRTVGAMTVAMGRVLPRKSVHEKTWQEIVILLASHQHEHASASASASASETENEKRAVHPHAN